MNPFCASENLLSSTGSAPRAERIRYRTWLRDRHAAFEDFSSSYCLTGIEEVAARIKPFGWHVQLHLNAEHLVEMGPRLDALPVDVVVDHLGHMPTTSGLGHPGFQKLLSMLREGRTWVKLSAPMRFEDDRPPYPSVTQFAQALIEASPSQCLWGTDWPHVIHDGFMPNDADLLDLLAVWAPDEALRNRILVDNPARLYGFDDD